jgi:hypothetical protein
MIRAHKTCAFSLSQEFLSRTLREVFERLAFSHLFSFSAALFFAHKWNASNGHFSRNIRHTAAQCPPVKLSLWAKWWQPANVSYIDIFQKWILIFMSINSSVMALWMCYICNNEISENINSKCKRLGEHLLLQNFHLSLNIIKPLESLWTCESWIIPWVLLFMVSHSLSFGTQ